MSQMRQFFQEIYVEKMNSAKSVQCVTLLAGFSKVLFFCVTHVTFFAKIFLICVGKVKCHKSDKTKFATTYIFFHHRFIFRLNFIS